MQFRMLTWLSLSLSVAFTVVSPLRAAFHIPYQDTPRRPECSLKTGGYFRPEYPELAERLDQETLDWLVRTYPVLGWRDMDPRVFRPKPLPGADRLDGFRYDTARRNMEVEAVFHFGPRGGNGTLIEEMVPLDGSRLLTVNRGSRNLSIINTARPDVEAVIPSPRGLRSFEINLPNQELYLLERNASGMLVWSLKDYLLTDTLFLNFNPGAVLLSRDGRFLYLTDEAGGDLVRLDLTRPADSPSRRAVSSAPPWLLAEDRESGLLLLAGLTDGRVALFDPASFSRLGRDFSLGAPLLAWCAPTEGKAMFLAAGSCERSAVYSLTSGDGEIALKKLADIGGAVFTLGTDNRGEKLCALSGRELYSLDPSDYSTPVQRSLPADPQRVLPGGSKIYVTAGMDWLLTLDEDLQGRIGQTQVEFGPGPLVARDGALWVANGLSSSITVLDAEKVEEKYSVLVGVLLGRMVHRDRRIVVNNLFRRNVMVLNPENYTIEEIVDAGGSLDYSAAANRVTMFDDSLAVGMDYPPSRLSISSILDLPRGVRLFTRLGQSESFLVADQGRMVERVDLNQKFRYGGVPLPAEGRGVFTWDGMAWVLTAADLYRFSVTETLGLDRSWPLRPFKFSPPYIAADYSGRASGSQVHLMYDRQVLDLTSIPGKISVIRNDPDTSFCWFGTSQNSLVFDRRDNRSLAVVPADGAVRDIYLPPNSLNAYVLGDGTITVADRRTFFRRDEIALDGDFVYASGEEMYVLDRADRNLLHVVDGYRKMIYQSLRLPVAPTDAASDGDRLFLLGGAEGAIAVYANRPSTERLPRSVNRHVWDTDADRRSGSHR